MSAQIGFFLCYIVYIFVTCEFLPIVNRPSNCRGLSLLRAMSLCSPVIPSVIDTNQLFESYRQSLHALTWTRNLLCLKWAKSTNEISQQQERSLFLQLLIMLLSCLFNIFHPPPPHYYNISPSECENLVWQENSCPSVVYTHIAGLGQTLLSSWHNWWAAGLSLRWLLPSTSQGLSCPGCWLAGPWRSSARPDWQQRSRTWQWPSTLREYKGCVIKRHENVFSQ